MRRILIAVLVLLAAWFIFKDMAYRSIVGASSDVPPEPDYFNDEAWLERPEELPPGGWETPWGVDVFLIAPPASRPAPAGLLAATSEEVRSEFDAFAEGTGADQISETVYAPAYRSPSPASSAAQWKQQRETGADDVRRAFKRYLSTDNRDRGLIIFAAPGAEEILDVILQDVPQTPDFRLRFGGVVVPAGHSSRALDESVGSCSEAFDACVQEIAIDAAASPLRFIAPALRKPKLEYTAEEDVPAAIEVRAEALSQWLDLNAVKPAEPFDTWAADEVVDVAPIRRPNQDEDISGDRGN